MEIDVALSSKGLSGIPMELHDGNFEFIVGEKRYNCNVIFAEFLSQKICSLRRADPTICEYALEVDDPSSNFESFLSLARGSHVRVSGENFDFFVSVARELENDELFSQLVDSYFASTEITTSNAVEFLKMKQLSGKSDEEIAFIARNFSDIENLSELGIDQLRLILSHPSLRIPSEDFLYNFICRMISSDKSFSELLEFVVFKFLSNESVQHFVNSSSSFIFDHLNPQIWKSLCGRLSERLMIRSDSFGEQRSRYGDVVIKDEIANLNKEMQQKIDILTRERDNEVQQHSAMQREKEKRIESLNKEMNSMKDRMQQKIDALTRGRDNEVQQHSAMQREKEKQIESLKAEVAKLKLKSLRYSGKVTYNGSNSFGGIISELTRHYGGNPHLRNVVQVSASSTEYGKPHQLLDYGWSGQFYTEDAHDSWIMLDMMHHRVSLTNYTVKSTNETRSPDHLKHWVIECSNDQQSWHCVDERHTDDLVGHSIVKTYSVRATGTFYRYIRMKQTGKNACNRDYLELSGFEIFGEVRPE